MNFKQPALIVLIFCAMVSCTTTPKESESPPAPVFDVSQSDPAAVELADSILNASGGQKAWDETRFISWNTSGERDISWDKQTGKVRIDSKGDQTIYLLNVNTGEGKVQQEGKEITDAETLKAKIHEGMQLWRTDSYALFLPFKLKEGGVSLVYLGEDTIRDGSKANIVEIQVKNEIQKIQRKYRIYVGINDNQIKQVADFNPAAKDSIGEKVDLENYKMYGSIKLAADRSDGKGPQDVKVDATLPDEIFDQF
jgi:hypothetical protein